MRALRTVIAVLALLAGFTTACTEGGTGGSGPGGAAVSGSGQTPSPAVAEPGAYTLDKSGVSADLRYEAEGLRLIVTNRSAAQIAAPGIYVLGASNGRRVAGRVTGYAPIPDGATYTFKVAFARAVAPEDVGLAILLVGAANFGHSSHPPGREEVAGTLVALLPAHLQSRSIRARPQLLRGVQERDEPHAWRGVHPRDR